MLTDDERRTLEVLEAVAWHVQTPGEIFALCDGDTDKRFLRELAKSGLVQEWADTPIGDAYSATIKGMTELNRLRAKAKESEVGDASE